MDKHVNHSISTTPSEDQLDWVEQFKPDSPTPFSAGAGAGQITLTLGPTRIGKTSLMLDLINDSICHGGQDHE